MKRPLTKKSDKHIGQNSLKAKAGLAALVLFVLFFALFQQVTHRDAFSRFAFMGDARNVKMAGGFLFSITDVLRKDANDMKEKADIRVLSFSADDIMGVPADIRKPIENLLKVEDVDIDINDDQAADFAIAKITGRSPDMTFRITEKLFTLDDVIVRKTKDGRIEIHVPDETYKGFLRENIFLKEGVRDKLNDGEISEKRKLLAMVVAKSIRYQPCGLRLDGKSQKMIREHLDYFVVTDLKSFLDEVDKHIGGRIAMEKAMDYIGVPRRETARMAKESFLAGKGAVLEAGMSTAIKRNISGADLAAEPLLPTGTLSPESMFAFSGMGLDANMEKIGGLLDVAFRNIAEDQRSVFIEGMNNKDSGSIERIQVFALLLKRSGILETDVGVIIDARTDGLNASVIARMINSGRDSSVIKPFILIDSRETYSELIIMGMPAESVILNEESDTPVEAIKMHMAKYRINVAPHNISFTVMANGENMDMLEKECIGPERADAVFNFVVIDTEDMLKNHNSKLLYANFINVANRHVLEDKPSVTAIGEKGINAVRDLYSADTGNTLSMILVKEPDLGKMIERFVDCLREK
jgi:hypothetical protein